MRELLDRLRGKKSTVIPDDLWAAVVTSLPFLDVLPADEQRQLQRHARLRQLPPPGATTMAPAARPLALGQRAAPSAITWQQGSGTAAQTLTLDDEVKDKWGLPVARFSLASHREDALANRALLDKGLEVLREMGGQDVRVTLAPAPVTVRVPR